MLWTKTANWRGGKGFTLVEVLVVVAIIALLIGVLVGVTKHIDTKKKEALTDNCLTILKTAVAEYHEITGHYPVDRWVDDDGDGWINSEEGSRLNSAECTSEEEPVGDELLYLQLSLLPQTREIISKLPSQLVGEPRSGAVVLIAGKESRYLQSIVDGWGSAINYERIPNPDDVDDLDSVFPEIGTN